MAGRQHLCARAWEILEQGTVHRRGRPVGVVAAQDDTFDPINYHHIFLRDFASVANAALLAGRVQLVRAHLELVAELQACAVEDSDFDPPPGSLPASFEIVEGRVAHVDFGEHAIARIAPIDSVFWWLLTLRGLHRSAPDTEWLASEPIQSCIRRCLELVLHPQLTLYPTLFVPEGSFMIDRRLGVYGHPIEIQVLFYAALTCACELLADDQELCRRGSQRRTRLAEFIADHYWLDHAAINRINRYRVEGYGGRVENPLNIQPESLPRWVARWLEPGRGFLAGNVGPGRLDGRFFTQGNLLAAACDLLDADRGRALLAFLDHGWSELVGNMPLKICYPSVHGRDWIIHTGRDPKNAPWSYHNGGSWPCLLGPLALACARHQRLDLLERALETAERRIAADDWQEYYDGEYGDLIGRRSRRQQSWTASGYLTACHLLDRPEDVSRLGFA